MKFVNFGILVFFLPTYLCSDLTVLKELATEELGLTCKNGMLGPNDFFAARLQSCDVLYGAGNQNSADCIFFCYSKVLGLLDDNDGSSWDKYEQLILLVLSTEHQQMVTAWAKDCWDRFGSKIDQEDGTCEMANQFNNCNWAIIPHLTC